MCQWIMQVVFEKCFVSATKIPAFHDVKRKYEGTEQDSQYFS